MRQVAVIYNPVSGQHFARRNAAAQHVLEVLRAAGVQAEAFVTDTPGSATAHARQAVRDGYDAVLACGGDGTVHEVLQSLVGTNVALGVVPLGTANALAANLGLIAPPAKAARLLLGSERVRIPVGRIHFENGSAGAESRYFLVAAGVGADALLMARLDPVLKRRFGYILYLIEAARIWATDPFPLFEAVFSPNGDGAERVAQVSQLLAVRVRSFGGALRELAPGATLRSRTLSLLAFGTRSRYHYLRFLLAVLAGRHTFAREIELVETAAVDCRAFEGSPATLYVEADGEVLGHLPARLETVPDALTLLVPAGAKP
ncbi:MAG TPA: diacylglycerol kinase family protein [Terracidiphilus sp.]